ncbi:MULTISPECIES: TetR/AcrR family transcriptional regulator [Streptomycetaceae]|uniref:TetR family transcriptional regulator n=1 Tax=Streptantibioticus cattleyicolor (strain ATCC 35852 / DSM 46488 / JCM 4925 / NBRC 14057 / NRRL 8057) TaxID=1003195 RepID=F8JXM6_STREN|nr:MULTISPECIES: TetR family transcriptional regulator [Streptomycetaceae]AEW97128.1 TetR family transcriptional regulator [Streptantibioticus cattleyicolor NRRL 8057 = DSM 46488]MYS61587.1 TetR family transcriptional regulator [Streptomyces sp. SID5468]CCB77452.1 putative TetR-family transcriptional regulator [Streptantibioticus cattleyicolor NRRL 8057 = DSM 46488]
MSSPHTAAGDGAPRRSDRTRAAILDAARERFATQGYERTTIRAVAADARIDPSMVMRYFGSKERLFEAALAVDLRLPDLSGTGRDELAAVLVGLFLDRWEAGPTHDTLLMLLRSAVTNERAAERLRAVFAAQVVPALTAVLGPEEGVRRAALLAGHLLGLAVTRYLVRLPEVAALSRDEVVAALTPALRATLEAD